MSNAKEDRLEVLTPEEAAAYLKISIRTLARDRKRAGGPRIPCTIISPRKIRYFRNALAQYLSQGAI